MPTIGPHDSVPPLVAIVCNTVPPYRRHLHQRIDREVEEIRLLTLNTHQDETRDWHIETADFELVNLPDLERGEGGRRGPIAGELRHRWRQGGRAIELLRERNAAAVIVNGYNDLGRLRIIHWCRRQRIPCFVWSDSNICGERRLAPNKASIKSRLLSKLLPRITGVFACGRYGVQYWQHYGATRERIFVAPYEPDYALIQDLPMPFIEGVAKELGLAPGRRRLLFCGRLVDVKRPDLLVSAFCQLAADRPEWDLVMLGEGPLGEELRRLVPESLAERVVWLPFDNDQRRVSAVYRACDVLVLPSDYEPWALVINEAVAAGLAVVATDVVGAAVELVDDGGNGYLVPPSDQPALHQALKQVTDPGKIDTLRTHSAEQLAHWRQVADPVEGYRQALRYAGVISA